MTTYKVTMIPACETWAPDDPRWVVGWNTGLWQEFTDPAEALQCMENATGLGWTVELAHLEDENVEHVAL